VLSEVCVDSLESTGRDAGGNSNSHVKVPPVVCLED
jgi:hypothetical protein